MLKVHCIWHRLALAYGDANDKVTYKNCGGAIGTALVILQEFCKENSCICQSSKIIESNYLSNEGNKKVVNKF